MKRIAILILIGFFVYSAVELITVRYQQRLLYIDLVRVQNEAKKLDQSRCLINRNTELVIFMQMPFFQHY